MDQAKASTSKGHGKAPPYVSFKTLKTFLEDVRAHGLPSRIDHSVMQRVSGTVRNQLMTALRFLGLVDGSDQPTAALRALVDTYDTENWPPALADVLKSAYPSIFSLGLDTVSPAQLAEAFRSMASSEEVRRKCYVFFVQAAQGAALPISKRVVDQMKRGAGGTPQRRRTAPKEPRQRENGGGPGNGAAAGTPRPDPPPPPPPGNPINTPQNGLLEQIVGKFPQFDPAWPDDVKAKWFEGFERLMGAVEPKKP